MDKSRGGRWGFKNPRQIYVLPVLNDLFPEMIFVHVVRDGRDMVLSANTLQRVKHYAALFAEDNPLIDDAASARMWATVNSQGADWCERELGPRYVRVRIEDLVSAGAETAIADLCNCLRLEPGAALTHAHIFRKKPSFGRWRSHEGRISDPDPLFAATLSRFGYRL